MPLKINSYTSFHLAITLATAIPHSHGQVVQESGRTDVPFLNQTTVEQREPRTDEKIYYNLIVSTVILKIYTALRTMRLEGFSIVPTPPPSTVFVFRVYGVS